MPMEIKICGLKRVEDALMVNEFENIKYVGFVFANTPRKITIEKALEIKKNLRPDIKTVGVFAGQPMEEIIEIMEKADLDVCQLHSGETNEDCGFINKTVWKSISVKDKESAEIAESYTNADGFVLDTFKKINGVAQEKPLIGQQLKILAKIILRFWQEELTQLM